jgi:hypothetical protein
MFAVAHMLLHDNRDDGLKRSEGAGGSVKSKDAPGTPIDLDCVYREEPGRFVALLFPILHHLPAERNELVWIQEVLAGVDKPRAYFEIQHLGLRVGMVDRGQKKEGPVEGLCAFLVPGADKVPTEGFAGIGVDAAAVDDGFMDFLFVKGHLTRQSERLAPSEVSPANFVTAFFQPFFVGFYSAYSLKKGGEGIFFGVHAGTYEAGRIHHREHR